MVRKKKKKLNIKKILVAIIILIIGIITIIKTTNFTKKVIIFNDYYISSDTNKITLYTYDEETKIMTDIDTIYRGTKVKSNDKIMTIGDINYTEIKLKKMILKVG